jgi:nucleoside-diphosphate-sugar epimerase
MRNEIIEEDLKFITSSDKPWNRLEGKHILISGANGMLGSYMVETILFLNEKKFSRKSKIYALVRNKERAMERFSHYKQRDDLIFIIQDVCQPIMINDDINFIIHAASQASPKYYGKDPVGTLAANVLGTHHLLKLAKEKGVESFLFMSSGEVYGDALESGVPIKEDNYGCLDPLSKRACYAEGKRAGEAMCVAWLSQYEVPVKIVRPFHTYGPSMRLDDGRVFADFVSDVVNKRNIIMRSDGRAVRTFCYIADATVAFFTVLLKGTNGEAYNVGDENGAISIRDLAKMLAQMFPERKLRVEINEAVKTEGYVKSESMRQLPDTTRLQSLGWKPQFSLREGFRRTINSFSHKI